MSKIPRDVRASIRHFAFTLANGTLDIPLLGDIDYRPDLVTMGSELEMVFTIFTNLLEVDQEGRVTNYDQAAHRAAEWIRGYCDPSYEEQPPFAEWETELA
ncbi:hypothetical protein ACFWDI_17345 [Streptomyces sp. NPDC060064]|uniref:DUF7677 family protein n=1 Tax=Streptomyces sp. NPDC060064 TaxID=3347049 RepID=UPI0036C510FA